MPIYTRTGDKGKTGLFDGTRVDKSDIRVEAYGTIDELNSVLGAALSEIQNSKFKIQNFRPKVKSVLEEIQHDLFGIGSSLAFPHPMPVAGLENRPKEFESLIDVLTKELPELKNFILPGGSKAGSLLHVARSVSRRAERRIVALNKKEELDSSILIYLNRLSDLLFTLARYVNYQEKQKETKWIKK